MRYCEARLAVALLVGCLAQVAMGQAIQTGTIPVRLESIATVTVPSNGAPNFGAHTGDPRFLYVGQQSGVIRILDFDEPSPLLATNFLNVGSALGAGILVSGFEQGLIGGTFHPDFNVEAAPGYRKFYTHTSETIGSGTPHFFHQSETSFTYNHQSVIREWTVGAPSESGIMTVDTSIASRVLMRIAQPQSNHNGGALAFGPDNYLYLALGDGGQGNDFSGNVNSPTDGHTNRNDPDVPGSFAGHGNGQDRRNVYGKVLRFKPTIEDDAEEAPPTSLSANGQYRIPDDNPFADQAPLLGEIYAYGLRNPFRISFDRESGKLYAGDVGQGTREEVNAIVKGGNYGWVAREGLIQNPTYPVASNPTYVAPPGEPFIDPIADYFNTAVGNGGQSVIGGFVYRGHTLGLLEGKYVFGDWNRSGVTGGGMMYMDIAEPGPNQVFDLLIQGPPNKPGSNLHGIAEDANGELYYMFANGQIVKLLPALTGLAGDYNNDGMVDDRDYLAWKASYLTNNLFADGNGDGVVDAADYTVWRNNFGSSLGSSAGNGGAVGVPEPAAIVLIGWLIALVLPRVRSHARIELSL
jgi:glucose/arabinose dehydrogenase